MSGWRAARWRRVLVAVTWIAWGMTPVGVSADSFALIVSGATGGAEFAERFGQWRDDLVAALRDGPRFDADHLVVLADAADRGVAPATAAGVRRALADLAPRLDVDSTLLIVLLGHGTYDGVDAKFNLVGPDLTADEWRGLVEPLPGRLIFVNTSAASFPYLESIAGPDRVVITATASAAQRYDTVFGEFLPQALIDPAADTNKDGRIAASELFVYTSAAVRRWYQNQGRLATEQALLDDTGEGRGVRAANREPGVGLASAVYIEAGRAAVPITIDDPRVAALAERRDALEQEVAELRAGRASVAPERYERELERLLLELAQISRQIREHASER